MYAQTSGIAVKLFRQWKARWINLIPKAVECLERDAYAFIRISISLSLSFSTRGGSAYGREFSPEFHRVIRPPT